MRVFASFSLTTASLRLIPTAYLTGPSRSWSLVNFLGFLGRATTKGLTWEGEGDDEARDTSTRGERCESKDFEIELIPDWTALKRALAPGLLLALLSTSRSLGTHAGVGVLAYLRRLNGSRIRKMAASNRPLSIPPISRFLARVVRNLLLRYYRTLPTHCHCAPTVAAAATRLSPLPRAPALPP